MVHYTAKMEQLPKLVSIELCLLLFMVCFLNNICNGVSVAGGAGPNSAGK